MSSPLAGSGSANAAEVFDREARRYDAWFDSHRGRVLFGAEVEAIRHVLRGLAGPALEVGIGTGRFAQALGVPYGVDPAWGALQLARRRGEALPFRNRIFGSVLPIVTLCFAEPLRLLREASRVLVPAGGLVVADILRDSAWGRWYLNRKKAGHMFYRHAAFYTLEELEALLARARFTLAAASSTLAHSPEGPPDGERAYEGIRSGVSFVCLLARKA